MGKPIQSHLVKPPYTIEMTTEERVEFLANLIVERIMADQQAGQVMLNHIERRHAALPSAATT